MSSTQPAKSLRVAIVTSRIESAYWTTVIAAAVTVLRESPAQSFCFTFGFGDAPDSPLPDAEHPFYGLISRESVDGVLLLSSASFLRGSSEFCASRTSLPMVSVGQRIAGVPSVWGHNAAGIRNMVDHLVDRCGRRRIAFIRGPEGNAEAQSRYLSFEDMRVERSLPVQSSLVVEGNFTEASGERATRQLFEENRDNPPDAIMAANDLMALGALKALKDLGRRVPEDVAVAGFDDLEASLGDPPLTTVRQPVYELGERAAELLLAQIRGEKVPEHQLFTPEVVVRKSCGARPGSRPSGRDSQPAESDRALRVGSGLLFAGLAGNAAATLADDKAAKLVEAFRNEILPLLKRTAHRDRATRLLEEFELAYRESHSEVLGYRRALMLARRQALARVEWRAAQASSIGELLEHLAEILPALSIDGFYLVLLDPRAGEPGSARLAFAYRDGQTATPPEAEARFEASRLLPGIYGGEQADATWLVEPLRAAEEWFGYAVMHGDIYDAQLLDEVCRLHGDALRRLRG